MSDELVPGGADLRTRDSAGVWVSGSARRMEGRVLQEDNMEAVTYDEVVRVWAQERFGLVDPPRNIAFFPYEDRATCGEGTCDFTERGVTVLVDGRGFDLVMDNMATLIREIVAVATVAG